MNKDKQTTIPWGEIGYITYKRTYARRLNESDPNSPTEEFHQTIDRVVKACKNQLKVGFNEEEEKELTEILLNLKGMVAGRFLWQLGTNTVKKLGLPSLQNCAVTVVDSPIRPFTWAMDMLMLGSGVGFNIQKENVYQIPKLKGKIKIERKDTNDADFIVPDSREGWVKLLARVLKAHFYSGEGFTYSTICVRSKDAPIKGFGGTSSGPEDLCWGINEIHKILNTRANKKVRPIDCLDIMNIIGSVVVAGNVRRSAQIAIGDYDDVEYLKAKRWDLGSIPNWRSMSNNSVICDNVNDLLDEFWQTYNQGEPYGLINLKLSKQIGRTGEYEYPDPDVVGYNPCVTGDTEILTKRGYVQIQDVINKELEIWNGFEWSTVTPKITGTNQHVLKVTLSDGRELTCTDYHKWYLAEGYTGKSKQVTTKDLKIGDKIIKYNFPILEEGEEVTLKHAYTQGFISAEGMDDYKYFFLYEPKYMCKDRLDVRLEGSESKNINGVERKSIYYNDNYNDKSFVPFEWALSSKIEWLAGLFDGDGTELIEGGLQLCSTDFTFLKDLQKLLSTLGINCKVLNAQEEGSRIMPDGKGGEKEYFCQKSYRICIGATQIQSLIQLGLQCNRMSFDKNPQRDASQFVKIVKIEEAGYVDNVYCFNEPIRHYGVFNGILTGQCAEQSLNNYETCCLAEIYLCAIESKEELFKVAKYLYRICKHSLALPCHNKETEEIVHKNMRMGIGITGVWQSTAEQISWLDDCYKYLRELDKEYSKQHGFNESIKLTTSKPSGTLSLLRGVTPGSNVSPAGPYFIRRVRISSSSPLIDVCIKNGYKVEFQRKLDGSIDRTTKVVEFPCSVPEHTPIAKDISAVQQLEMIQKIQKIWSDNSVSVTVTYKMEELPEIKKWLSENYSNSLKTVSFLLYSGHGFDQAPYETIDKEEYLRLREKVIPITSIEVKESEMIIEECAGGACPIK